MDDDGEDKDSQQHDAKLATHPKSIWYQALSTSLLFVLIAMLSFICVHLVTLMLQWLFEGRRFYSVRQVNRAVFEYYKHQLYLWYLMIRNWDCHEDGKIKVIMPNYLAR